MLQIDRIPAFDDNYIWALHDEDGEVAAVVDPGEAAPVLAWLDEKDLRLGSILITHKHGDHVGGVGQLTEAFSGVTVYGPANEPIGGITRPLAEQDMIKLPGVDAVLQVLDVPGHTEGHIAYYGEGVLFCGDTLFAGGCGRVFSGTHEQLSQSLEKIARLAPETQIYCAHEYTRANMGFARWVEPDNALVQRREQQVIAARERGESTVPSILEDELKTNPFMRTCESVVISAAERFSGQKLTSSDAVFRAIREWKDREYD